MDLQNALLANRCRVPITDIERIEITTRFGGRAAAATTDKDHPAWHKLYYKIQMSKARDHLAKLAVDFPRQAEIIAPYLDQWLADAAAAKVKKAALKAEKQARAKARADKAAQRKALGVNLKAKGGVNATEATYLALRAGLKDLQAKFEARVFASLETQLSDIEKVLAAHHGDVGMAYPFVTRTGVKDHSHANPSHPLFWRWFERTNEAPGCRNLVRRKANTTEFNKAEAARIADEHLASFSAKLAGKVDTELAEHAEGKPATGQVERVTCTSGDVWTNSILTVDTNYGRQVWHTKIIWNTSVLGKQFNQWPTTRVK